MSGLRSSHVKSGPTEWAYNVSDGRCPAGARGFPVHTSRPRGTADMTWERAVCHPTPIRSPSIRCMPQRPFSNSSTNMRATPSKTRWVRPLEPVESAVVNLIHQ